MNKLKFFIALFLMAMSFLSYGQEIGGTQYTVSNPKIIAVVNRANWCAVCKTNGERFGNNIMPYASKGVAIVMNDLTNDSTIAKSKEELKKTSIYKQIYKTNRKGVGKMMQACGLIHDKNKAMASGIVTFIDAKRLEVLNESSIAVTDQEMKSIIDNLLKK